MPKANAADEEIRRHYIDFLKEARRSRKQMSERVSVQPVRDSNERM
ncbi:hypothetical protein HNR44_003276 [Geomicrobium halophilum]|uniref:Uncharacterized protein n=1 Tax=Geomicrobium halophilum TaxID=549000 RepID=A0A841Q0S4_9BACL|nr:hypothetical protein [Geomicrobium halophilum]